MSAQTFSFVSASGRRALLKMRRLRVPVLDPPPSGCAPRPAFPWVVFVRVELATLPPFSLVRLPVGSPSKRAAARSKSGEAIGSFDDDPSPHATRKEKVVSVAMTTRERFMRSFLQSHPPFRASLETRAPRTGRTTRGRFFHNPASTLARP